MKITEGMPFEQYRAIDAVSSHGLMLAERSPRHYWASKNRPHEPTPAMMFGTLVHSAILEPADFERRAVIAPSFDRRTKDGKAAAAEFEANLPTDALILNKDQQMMIDEIRKNIAEQRYASALLDSGRAELTLEWTDQETGLECKARPDWLCNDLDVIVDLKTAHDASEEAFKKSAGNFKYHMQAAFYIDAIKNCGLGERSFVLMVVENEYPHAIALYEMDAVAINAGRTRYRKALKRLAECKANDNWVSYPTEIQLLSIPSWAL